MTFSFNKSYVLRYLMALVNNFFFEGAPSVSGVTALHTFVADGTLAGLAVYLGGFSVMNL